MSEESDERLQKAYRANGELICKECGKDYYSHPLCYEFLNFYDEPFLNILCNGDIVKL